jgi:hypothetical protein
MKNMDNESKLSLINCHINQFPLLHFVKYNRKKNTLSVGMKANSYSDEQRLKRFCKKNKHPLKIGYKVWPLNKRYYILKFDLDPRVIEKKHNEIIEMSTVEHKVKAIIEIEEPKVTVEPETKVKVIVESEEVKPKEAFVVELVCVENDSNYTSEELSETNSDPIKNKIQKIQKIQKKNGKRVPLKDIQKNINKQRKGN